VRLTARVHGRSYRFASVREVLARANEPKSGDALAGIGARSHLERAAAKRVVAELTLEDLRAHPVAPLDDDEVSRVIDAGVEERTYREIRGWSVAELRDWLLDDATTAEAIRATSRGLTAEMAAAVAKLCSNLDLVYGARKMPVRTQARTTVGLPGRLSSRLQPNHPADDPLGITAAIYEAGFNSSSRFYATTNQVLGMTPSAFRKGGADTEIRFAVGECSLGSILVAQSDLGVCAILMGDDPAALARDLQDRFPHARLIGGDAAFEKLVATVVGFVEARLRESRRVRRERLDWARRDRSVDRR
jgi:AraC-like DNA-binding protein